MKRVKIFSCKKIISIFLAFAFVFAVFPEMSISASAFSRSTDVIWKYSESVTPKKIRYIAQAPSSGSPSQYFNANYWKDGNGKQGCFVASTSMVLSYLGINITPKKMFELGMARNISSTSFNDMYASATVATKATSYSGISISSIYTGSSITSLSTMDTAINNFVNNGDYYSPVIVFQKNLWNGHYYVVTRKISGSTYEIVDPVSETYSTREITYVSDVIQYKRTTPITAKYSISYNANGGSGAPGAQTKTHGVNLTLSTVKPTRTGYTFLGWATSQSATTAQYAAGSTYSNNANITLYAVWKINTYTVSYDANGGSGAPETQTKIFGSNLLLSTSTPIRNGYAFQGWATSEKAEEAQYQPGEIYSSEENITLYAVWKDCYVWSDWSTFKPSGEYESRTEYRYKDKSIIKTGSQTVSGYTFISKDLVSTTYSCWDPWLTTSHTNKIDEKYSYENSLESVTGYRYNTYYNSSNNSWFWYNAGGVKNPRYLSVFASSNVSPSAYDDGHGYVSADKTLNVGSSSKLGTIYGIFTWNVSNGVASGDATYENKFASGAATTPIYTTGTAVTLKRNVEKKYQYTHYKWGEWSDWSVSAVSANDNRQVETRVVYRYKTGEQHLFSDWNVVKAATCTESGEQTRQCSVCDEVETGAIPALGHSYDLWVNDIATGIRHRTCSRCGNVEKEVYLYNISYDANGGSGAPKTQVKTKDIDLVLSEERPNRLGYSFIGWASSANATSVNYVAGETYTNNAATTLFAVWKANSYQIKYNLEGGYFKTETDSTYEWDASSGIHVIQQKNPQTTVFNGNYKNSNTEYFTVEKPVKDGYVFEGWEISGMDDCTHCYNKKTSECVEFNSSEIFVSGNDDLDFKNLRSSEGVVTFTAKWKSAHIHNYTETIITPATCTENGAKELKCACGDSYTELIEKLGHTYSDEWTVDSEATCTTDGTKSHHCIRCSSKTDETKIPAKNHANTIWITEEDATCTNNGLKYEFCLDCSELVNTVTIPATGHKNIKWKIIIRATCTKDGIKEGYCTDCSAFVGNETIPALGHKFVLKEENAEHPHDKIFKCVRCSETKREDGDYSGSCPECNFTTSAVSNKYVKITGYKGNEEKLTLPAKIDGKNVTATATGALKANSNLKEIKIENGIKEIGSLTFMNCSALEKAIIPQSVTTIGTYVFYGCAEGLTIYCYSGSVAQKYAEDNKIPYVLIDIGETPGSIIDYNSKCIFTKETGISDISQLIFIPEKTTVITQASFVTGNCEYIGTGSVVSVFSNGELIGEYTVIVEGDLNGDSVCDIFDAVCIEKIANGQAFATSAQAYAVTGTLDGEITISDYLYIVNKALGG